MGCVECLLRDRNDMNSFFCGFYALWLCLVGNEP